MLITSVLAILMGCSSRQEGAVLQDLPDSGPADTITIAACYSGERLTRKWVEEYGKLNPAVPFKVTVNESSSCVASLDDRTTIALISRELLPEEDSVSYCISSVAKHGVVLVVSAENPYIDIIEAGVTKEAILEIYKTGSWNPLDRENSNPLHIYYRTPRAGNTWNLLNYLGLSADSMTGVSVETDTDIIEALRKDPYGLGYCSHINAYDIETNAQAAGIRVVPIKDQYGLSHDFYDSLNLMKRAIWNGRYQFHLYPTLYIVMKAKPKDEQTKSFLRWVFTDGQQIVEEEGYIKLRNYEIGCRIKEL